SFARVSLIPLTCLFDSTSPPALSTLSLHDALPISRAQRRVRRGRDRGRARGGQHHLRPRAGSVRPGGPAHPRREARRVGRCDRADRKSTRLNSSHVSISYAVFCLKKKTKTNQRMHT